MTKREHGDLIQYVLGLWPHASFTEATFAVWWDELQDLPVEVAMAAVKVLNREGREHAPTPGLIRRRAVQLAVDAPAWSEVLKALRRIGRTGIYSTVYGAEAERQRAAWSMLERHQPIVRAFVKHLGFRQIAENFDQGGNGEARLRTKWEEYVRESVDTGSLAGLPPAGLARLERANATPVPIGDAIRAVLEAPAA